MADMATIMREEARLVILRQLAGEVDGVLNSSLIQQALVSWGINKAREWVHAELVYLDQVGAVTAVPNGSVMIATITARGIDHVERRTILPGVKRPGPVG